MDVLDQSCVASRGRTSVSYQGAGRVIFDITTSVRWSGPPVGIVRVERQLAIWALTSRSDVKFAFFDPRCTAYCEVKTDIRDFLVGAATLETLGLPDPAKPGRRKTDRAPAVLRSAVLWIGRSRRMALGRLETVRLGATRPWLRRLAGRVQESLMSKKYRDMMVAADGTRQQLLPYRTVLGPRIDLVPSDTLICAGIGWAHTNIAAIREMQSRIGFRFILFCHDLIPLLFPQFYLPHDVELFRAYMHQALATADLIAVTSQTTRQDCQLYCRQHGIATNKIAVVPLGINSDGRNSRVAPLPDGLSPGRFVLMVSTIEPRKGHRLLYNVWRRLTADGVTTSRGVKLVFVGRRGWMVDDLMQKIRTDKDVCNQILIVSDADDMLLNSLYQGAAFCVYPSRYEGYGLPICEAFSHGKGTLASTAGALPELVGDLSPCLDPEDEDAWYHAMKRWIEYPDAKAPFEHAIKLRFRHPTWSEAAANFFAICDSEFAGARF